MPWPSPEDSRLDTVSKPYDPGKHMANIQRGRVSRKGGPLLRSSWAPQGVSFTLQSCECSGCLWSCVVQGYAELVIVPLNSELRTVFLNCSQCRAYIPAVLACISLN